MWLKLAAFIFDKKGTARRPEVIAVSLAPGADQHKIFEWKTTRPHTSEVAKRILLSVCGLRLAIDLTVPHWPI
jgi:hypothetical protein